MCCLLVDRVLEGKAEVRLHMFACRASGPCGTEDVGREIFFSI